VDKEGWRPNETSSALVFGDSVHRGCLGALVARADGQAFDPEQTFIARWEHHLSTTNIQFNSTHGEESLREIGRALCRSFLAHWDTLGLVPVLSDRGLLVEQRLRVRLSPTVGLSGEPDIVAMDGNGQIWVIDLKTPATASFEGFAGIAEQLTAYQILYDAHAPSMGLPPVSHMMFLEGLKQNNPRWVVQTGPRHSDSWVRGYTEKLLKTAQLMQEGYYPRRTAAAYNSPCSQCDMAILCQTGQTEGYVKGKRKPETPPQDGNTQVTEVA